MHSAIMMIDVPEGAKVKGTTPNGRPSSRYPVARRKPMLSPMEDQTVSAKNSSARTCSVIFRTIPERSPAWFHAQCIASLSLRHLAAQEAPVWHPAAFPPAAVARA